MTAKSCKLLPAKQRKRGTPCLTWKNSIREAMKMRGIQEENESQNRKAWSKINFVVVGNDYILKNT